jgi:glutaredoxin
MSEKFYVYSKDGCGFCDRLTEFMESKGVTFEKFTLDNDFTKEEFIEKFGYNSTFPQVLFNHNKVGGMKDTVRYLADNQLI